MMNAAAPAYDRSAEDLGNIVLLEHVNFRQNDQRLATLFYVAGLGLTRDPYMHVSDVNMSPSGVRSSRRMRKAKMPPTTKKMVTEKR